MRFSWKALIIAPLVAPGIYSFLAAFGNKSAILAFFFLFALSSAFCYGVTVTTLLPTLYCVSLFTRLNLWKVCLIGFLLGIIIHFPVSLIFYGASGTDSGPPEGTFIGYLARSFTEGFTWMFFLVGAITAAAYWLLTKVRLPQVPQILPQEI